jgi:hypothetical protein
MKTRFGFKERGAYTHNILLESFIQIKINRVVTPLKKNINQYACPFLTLESLPMRCLTDSDQV